jgi:hypothetical protein
VVIVKEESYGSDRRPRQRWVAVALDRVRWGLDEQAFVRLLNERGLDRTGFVDLVLKRMAGQDKQAGRRQVFSVILKGKATPAKDSQDADEKPDREGGEASDGTEAAQGASG